MERALYALAVAVLIHAAATYFGGPGRYAVGVGGSLVIQDTRTGALWMANTATAQYGLADFRAVPAPQ